MRAAGGDGAAFSELVRCHGDRLFSFVLWLTRDHEDARDLVQESLAAAWRARDRHDPNRRYEPWLRRIALNKYRDRRRHLAVRGPTLYIVDEAWRGEIRDLHPGVDHAVVRDQALSRLEQAIAGLPPGLRAPLVLTALEERSHKEAAALLGTTVKAVQARVYRARNLLASTLARADLEDVAA